jgi:DNA-binding response OmpR family regulator
MMAPLSDYDLRLECARLVAVFSNGEGNQVAQTEKLFRFVKAEAAPFCPNCGYDLRQDEPIEIGDARFDPRIGFSFEGRAVDLPPNVRILVQTLMKARGCWVANETLADRMDNSPDDVRVHVRHARERLATVGADRFIQNRYGLGYRWAEAA